ncbi:hypothetical protein D5086_028816 [Populus alba]|uniref:Uncharacterized protein n=1 Tax=Populus alba TaxID=43335 RepID=A0ACC4ASK5_POPAL
MDESCPNPRKFSYQTLACATNNFSEKDKLGEGATGSVFKGFLRELSCSVAVKRIAFGSKYGMESYLPEVKVLTKLKHENLVNLVGWSCNKKELLIVYELVANKTLEYHLFKETPAVEQFQENGMKFELKLVDWVCEKIERGENVSAVADPRLGLSYDEKEMEQLIFLNPSLQNEIENENLGLPEKDIGSQGPRKKIVKKGFHGRLLRLLEMKWKVLKREKLLSILFGFQVKLHFSIRSDLIILENGILVSKSEEGVEFHIGDGNLCPALSKAVKTMSKGLFRRSQAYLKTSELEKAEAEADIKKAPAIDPNNRLRFKLPPGPRPWPVVGNLYAIKPIRFRCFAEWAQAYGPVVSVWFGSTLNVVVCNAELAKQVLKENDQQLADRHRSRLAARFSRDGKDLIWADYGPHYVKVRRVSTLELFSAKRLEELRPIREDEVTFMAESIFKDCTNPENHGKTLLVKKYLGDVAFNNITRLAFGKRFMNSEGIIDEQGQEFKAIVSNGVRLGGSLNMAEHIPWLQWMFPLEEEAVEKHNARRDRLTRVIMEEHTDARKKSGGHDYCWHGYHSNLSGVGNG